MLRCLLFALVFAIGVMPVQAQQKTLLETEGWGSLSGKVTLVGKLPPPGPNWVVDPKTKAVAEVMIWVKTPTKDQYFAVHPKLKGRKDTVVINVTKGAFLPYVSAYNPVYFDGKQMVKTGQELIIRNNTAMAQSVRAIGDGKKNDGFNRNLPPMTELNITTDKSIKLVPQLMPLSILSDIDRAMSARLYVFDHPYYAMTKADGTFEIPFVPAGAEIRLMAHHGEVGWLLTKQGEFKAGRPITLKPGEKTTINLTIDSPVK